MIKYLLLLLILMLSSCGKQITEGYVLEKTTYVRGEVYQVGSVMYYVPEGAVFIRSYQTPNGQTLWTKWKLENDCYLSYNVIAETGLLAKTTCVDSLGAK